MCCRSCGVTVALHSLVLQSPLCITVGGWEFSRSWWHSCLNGSTPGCPNWTQFNLAVLTELSLTQLTPSSKLVTLLWHCFNYSNPACPNWAQFNLIVLSELSLTQLTPSSKMVIFLWHCFNDSTPGCPIWAQFNLTNTQLKRESSILYLPSPDAVPPFLPSPFPKHFFYLQNWVEMSVLHTDTLQSLMDSFLLCFSVSLFICSV